MNSPMQHEVVGAELVPVPDVNDEALWEIDAIPWTAPLQSPHTIEGGWEPIGVAEVSAPLAGEPVPVTRTCLIVRRRLV